MLPPWPAVLCLLSAVGAVYVLGTMWNYRDQPGARYWLFFTMSIAVWSLCYGVGLLVFDTTLRRALDVGVWLAKGGCPPAMLGIGLAYTGRTRLAYSRWMTVNIAFWLVASLMYATNPIHHLVWTGYQITPVLDVATVSYTRKPLLFILYAVAYSQIGISIFLLLESLYEHGSNYRWQILGVVVGFAFPVMTSCIWLFQLGPVPELNLTPIAFTATVLLTVPVLFGMETFEVSPSVVRHKAVEDLPDPFLAVDDDGHLVDFNPEAKQLIEGLKETKLDDPLSDVSPTLATKLDLESEDDSEVTIETTSGTQHFDVNTSPYRGPRNEKRGKHITLRNITRLKEREQALRERERELERQNEQLDQFASVVSHDLRNPISVVSGKVELARQQPTDEHLDEIEAGIERMETIIDDMLTMARQSQTIEETERTDLDVLCQEAWSNVKTEDASMSVETAQTIECDRTRLLQAFENVFRNACDHNDQPLTVRVGTLNSRTQVTNGGQPHNPTAANRDKAGFYIEDDGVGIPVDERDNIFEHGHTTSDDGTGLGLFITKEIINAHGWEIRVTDGPNGGARFEITGVELYD